MLLDYEFDNLISEFIEHPEFGSGIFQQLVAEKRIGGFNFPTNFKVIEWFGPHYTTSANGTTWVAKYWSDNLEDIYTAKDGKKI